MKDSISNIGDCDVNSMLLPMDIPRYRDRILIAGPCSAESREQVAETAGKVAEHSPEAVFRAGIWKPRTSPGSFEGHGVKALAWLVEEAARNNLPSATEVALPEHVALASQAGVDIFWIGARTAANPFAMQAVAEAIAAFCPDKPVFVKNPVSPDLELWIGALKRLLMVGVRHLGAIHRGFSVYKSAPYRNAPIWQIPMELHRRIPLLPVVHDPSHTGGSRAHIAGLSQQAMDMGLDGLMIESHPHPECALSDGGQQLTPADLAALLDKLKIRDTTSGGEMLEQLRSQIDELDNELLSVLGRRFEVCRRIGEYKSRVNMPVMQSERYSRLVSTLLERGAELGLESSFLTTLLELIHAESVRTQLSIINDKDE